MSSFETVMYEKSEGIARITLHRPEAHNMYNVRMRDELHEILGAVALDEDIRAVILRGSGDKAFCAGSDLDDFLTAPAAVRARQIRVNRDVVERLRTLPQPLIGALHGLVFGMGMELALFCDIRIAADNAIFGMPEVGLGIIPGAGGTQNLPRIIGLSRALDMLLTTRRMDAQEALAAGLVSQVVPAGELLTAAESIAKKIASFQPIAVRNAKQAIRQGIDMTLEQGLELERAMAELTNRANRAPHVAGS